MASSSTGVSPLRSRLVRAQVEASERDCLGGRLNPVHRGMEWSLRGRSGNTIVEEASCSTQGHDDPPRAGPRPAISSSGLLGCNRKPESATEPCAAIPNGSDNRSRTSSASKADLIQGRPPVRILGLHVDRCGFLNTPPCPSSVRKREPFGAH